MNLRSENMTTQFFFSFSCNLTEGKNDLSEIPSIRIKQNSGVNMDFDFEVFLKVYCLGKVKNIWRTIRRNFSGIGKFLKLIFFELRIFKHF